MHSYSSSMDTYLVSVLASSIMHTNSTLVLVVFVTLTQVSQLDSLVF